MSRYESNSSYGHFCKKLSEYDFIIGWTYDRYFPNDRLRHPTIIKRATNFLNAKRFCEKWHIDIPTKKQGAK